MVISCAIDAMEFKRCNRCGAFYFMAKIGIRP